MKFIPDPHGQAALMLCESLTLALIGNGSLLKEQMVEAIEGLIEIQQEIAGVSERLAVSTACIGLLRAISQSIAAAPAAVPR